MFWKDSLYFSRSERNGIKVLLVLIILVAFAPGVVRHVLPRAELDVEWVALHVDALEDQLAQYSGQSGQSNRAATPPGSRYRSGSNDQVGTSTHDRDGASGHPGIRGRKTPDSAGERNTGRQYAQAEVVLSPRAFNPNELSAEEWEAMGLPAHVVRTIKNYEAAGGSFRFKEDLQRIYLMAEEWYMELEPFIELPGRNDQEAFANTGEDMLKIDINLADTTELINLRGIGQVFSRRIVEYRERLGGFVDPAQLLEVFGMDSARFLQVLSAITIDTSAIRKISIHDADFITLVRHPYIDRNLANALLSFRDQHQPLDSLAQLRQSFLITDEVYDRVSPYLRLR